jgi:moderate conductance mechanosensitive channel
VGRAAAYSESPRASARATTLAVTAAALWRAVVLIIAILVVLSTVGIDLTPVLAGATVVGAVLAFGAQSVVKDLLSGFFLVIEGQYDIGDGITVGTTSGTVEDLSLRVTRVRSFDGSIVYVPNGEIRVLANTSRGWARAIVDIAVPASTDVDRLLEGVRQASTAVTEDAKVAAWLEGAPSFLGIVSSDAEHLTARVTARTSSARREDVERALREEITRRLQADGVFTSGVTS